METKPNSENWVPEIDLHCHILPEWDDGPDTLEDALAMCQRAADAGMKIVFATPHVGRDFRRRKRKRPADVIAEGVASLQNAVDERGIALQILPGAEILLGSVDVQTRLPGEMELTYGHKGKFALIESPFPTWPPFGWQVVQNMSGARHHAGHRAPGALFGRAERPENYGTNRQRGRRNSDYGGRRAGRNGQTDARLLFSFAARWASCNCRLGRALN